MLTRRTLLKLPALGALASYFPDAWPAPVVRQRALIIGIDKYELPDNSAEVESPSPGAHAAASAVAVKRENRFHDLDGAVNDAELMNQLLIDRFHFSPTDIRLLTNQQATREQILHAFQSHLIDAASPGDISLFYYAGHGSQVVNLASEESDHLDETLVPADASLGAHDIRDKEMVRLYRAALKKEILLTVVLDSCHSGGMSRGAWNKSGKTRNLPPDPRSVKDPPDVDPATGKAFPDPTSMGMLFIGAAREDQPAGETTITQRTGIGMKEISHGAFTAAFAQVVNTSAASQSIEQLCERVQAKLSSEGKSQVPICAGNERSRRDLVNRPAGSTDSLQLPVEAVLDKGAVRLRGGSALGLAPGCRLVRAGTQPVRVELTRVELGTSEAKVLSGSTAALRAGDLFALETWAAPASGALTLYLGADGPDLTALLAAGKTIASLAGRSGLTLVSEPRSEAKPTHVLFWQKGAYHLESFPADGKTVALGRTPSADAILAGLNGQQNVRLWVMLPPEQAMLSGIRLGAGTANAAVRLVNDPAACAYLLTGRLNREQTAVEYSWVLKDALVGDQAHASLPLQSDWTTSAAQVTAVAMRLARVYGWLNMEGPPRGDSAFPYQLVFARPGEKEPAGKGPFKFGERYKFALQAAPEALKQAAAAGGVIRRYVYVFLIDSAGNATCFFPEPQNGNDSNLLPRSEPAAPWVELTRKPYDLEVSEPAGTDAYFLVSSEQPLDPGIFQWAGVRKPEARRGADNPLEFLFATTGEGTRGAQAAPSVPATWSIAAMSIRSGP